MASWWEAKLLQLRPVGLCLAMMWGLGQVACADDVLLTAVVSDGVVSRGAADASSTADNGQRCGAGLLAVADQCVPASSLTQWCGDYCASLALACPPGQPKSTSCQAYCDQAIELGPLCVAECEGAIDEPGAAAKTICGGLARRMDSVDCEQLALCAEPVTAPSCASLCDAAQGCGLVHDSRLLLGGSRDECVLYCQGLATALTPTKRFGPLTQCLAKALTTCDALGVLGCTVVGVPALDSALCSTVATDCKYIPDIWTDSAACAKSLGSWSAGQRIAAGGCLEIGGNYANCAERPCASPPAALPSGAKAAAQAILAHCPQLLSVPADNEFAAEFYAWMFVAVLQAFGKPVDRNYALISACFVGSPCPTTREGTLECLLTTPKD